MYNGEPADDADRAAIRTLPVSTKVNGKRRPEYQSYKAMIARCYRPSTRSFDRYGGRGIAVCDRWRKSFSDFFSDVGLRPSANHSLERIDSDGDYEPGNVRWATAKEQSRNMCRNRVIEIDGRAQCVSAWAEERGITPQIITARLKRGWSPRDAVMALTRRELSQ